MTGTPTFEAISAQWLSQATNEDRNMSELSEVEALEKARALINKPHKWTQETYARDFHGEETENYREAICFCSIGALERACGSNFADEVPVSCYYSARKFLAGEMNGAIVRFNDSHTHAEVLSAFDRAISAAKAQGE